MSDMQFEYRLTTSTVRFAGTRTETRATSDPTADPIVARQGTATLQLRADRRGAPHVLLLSNRALTDSKASLAWTDDGRLSSTAFETTGQAGQVLGSVAGALGTFVAAAEKVTLDRDALDPGFDGQAALTALLAIERQIVDEISATDAAQLCHSEDARQQLFGLGESLKFIRREIVRLSLAKDAWQAHQSIVVETSYDFLVDLGELPTSAELQAFSESPVAGRASGVWQEVWETLGIMATVEADPGSASEAWPVMSPAIADDNVIFRVPRVVRMLVWRRPETGSGPLTKPVSSMVATVVDAHSALAHIRFADSGWFGHRAMSIQFGQYGSMTALSADADSVAVGVASLAANLPTKFSAGVDAGVGVAASLSKAAGWSSAQSLASLNDEKARLQLEHDIAVLQAGGTAPS